MENSKEPAFPFTYDSNCNVCPGLTKLEYFTAISIQGLLSNPSLKMELGVNGKDNAAISKIAVEIAKSTLKELETTPSGNKQKE